LNDCDQFGERGMPDLTTIYMQNRLNLVFLTISSGNPFTPNRSRSIANFETTPIFVQKLPKKLNDFNGDQFGERGMPDLVPIYMEK
jgi:hypothetical protein